MKSPQFWILTVISTLLALLMINEIFLSRAIIRQQHLLVDNHKIADADATYESAWKQLALKVYKGSTHDPVMAELLKSESITVHEGEPPPAADSAAHVPSTPPPGPLPGQPETP